TSINLALPQLKSNIQRVFSPNTFVGGVHQDNKCGVWAMAHEDSHYGTGLQFKKSIFFFESGLMVCLGSDISSAYASKTQSTLLQNVLSSSDYTFAVNGKTVSETDYTYSPQNGPVTILDNQGKGIYVPMDTHLNITRGIQNSETMRCQESSGDVITAWFNHASDNSYEYAILMKATPDELEDMVATPSYEVVRQDEKAHIVSLPGTKQTAYALFDSKVELTSGLIKSSTLPIMAMVSQLANGHQKISICNPDFNRNKPRDIGDVNTFDELFGPFQPQTLQIELRDAWDVESLPANMKIIAKSAETTILEIETHDALSYTITLQPDTSTSLFHSDGMQQMAWPNPVTQDIHFHSVEQAHIFTLEGTLLASGENISSFNMTNYQTGTYLLKLVNGSNSQTVKIIKTK
ncbi:MAG: T9SS type A sorting domain-containing protein, partial [Pseudodesulfovibrio sp.]|nr:T9SS type A sorting domain-containing protein [Pseudodesulfovibrio sp.]